MGNVLSAGMGQAPARQAAIFAGLPPKVVCTTINKVCASGLKAVSYAAQTIQLGQADVIIAGGMECMSQVPHYLRGRSGLSYGTNVVEDGVVLDGLTDVYNQVHMGVCGENTAEKYAISRQAQDEFAISSYRKAQQAWSSGKFDREVIPVKAFASKKQPKSPSESWVSQDGEYSRIDNFDKVPTLKPAFKKADGTITAANSSKLSDGASALLLMSRQKASSLGLRPLARILAYADAEKAPIDFPTSPAAAVPKALKLAGLQVDDIDVWEFNEAFAVVGIVNPMVLGIPLEKVNLLGGAISLGHPLGSSGSRILVTLTHLLRASKTALRGCAAICNGGGGATAIVIEKC
eukprot:Sdes_comp20960_c1_seq1m18713